MQQERHEHERRDRNAQRPFHVFANHFISFRSNLQKRAHAPKVATVYLAITTSLANGARGPAVGEPGLEHPADHRADRGFCPKASEALEEAEADALAYLDFPYEHHVRLRTNNVQ